MRRPLTAKGTEGTRPRFVALEPPYAPTVSDGPDAEATGGRWRELLDAEAVAPGQVKGVACGDLDLVVWRTAAGEVSVMDARCPHLWSHLAAEGAVDGEELVCTAHFWRFDTSGAGVKLAASGRRDRKGDIAVYPCRERDGTIEAVVEIDP